MSRRKLKYGSQDWFDTIHSEIRVPRKPRVPLEPIVQLEPINVNVMYPQMAPCPPGYRYRPKRKPGQRKCTKETVKSVLSFLQMLATQNRISIFKPRKDKKGYTRTLLTIPQLKSRLTRHGISYKNSQFGMQSLDATSRAMRRSALRSGNAPYTSVYSEISDLTSRNPGRTSEAARGSAILGSAVRAAQLSEMRAAAARMRERVEAHRAAARARYREQQLTGRGGSRDLEDTASTRAIEFGRIMRFGMEAPSDVQANAHSGTSTEHQSPPWRDSQDPPFHGMTEEDYNEVQAMIRSRPQRQRQPRQPLTPEQLALRAELWEGRAEELESRGESSEGWTEWRDGQRVPLPSWREILEARRARNPTSQDAIQDAVARYLQSNPPGAGAAFGVLQPRRSISDSRNVRRDFEDARSEMENLRRRRGRELMRREIAGDIIFPDRPWHRAAPPYATTIQRYARGMNARNTI
jgi:hypothetical protein